jgi:hypothetical protein
VSVAAIAIALGILGGLIMGGRPANAGLRPIRAGNALWAGVALEIAPHLVDVSGAFGLGLVLAGYAMLLAFVLANLRLVGMPVVLVGILLNVVAIGLNQGMPVRADAVVAAHQAERAELPRLDLGAKRHLEDADDRLTFLGDTVPIPPLHEVVSFGDLILAFGVADVAFRLLRPVGLRRQRGRHRVLVAQEA